MTESIDKTRPTGGDEFEAVLHPGEGWLCLAPWIRGMSGYWWRPRVHLRFGYDENVKTTAEHVAREINKAMQW